MPQLWTLSRRQIAETAFSALGRAPRLMTMPVWVFSVVRFVYGLFNRRMGEFLAFLQLAVTHPCVAPTPGKRRLRDYFSYRAKALVVTSR